MAKNVRLAVLNGMAGPDIEASMEAQLRWGLRTLDLKDQVYGKRIVDLTEAEAERLRHASAERGFVVSTLSTVLFHHPVQDREAFAESLKRLPHVLCIARILKPTFIRLLSAMDRDRPDAMDAPARIEARHPWLIEAYREAIDRIDGAGFRAAIENEKEDSIFGNEREIAGFFELLDRGDRVRLVWDVQNLWQASGTAPTIETYRALKPLIGMVHLKGGRSETQGGPLVWRSSLEHASWPLVEIVSAAIRDGVSPVMCINPSHGKVAEGFRPDYQADVDYLRRTFAEIE